MAVHVAHSQCSTWLFLAAFLICVATAGADRKPSVHLRINAGTLLADVGTRPSPEEAVGLPDDMDLEKRKDDSTDYNKETPITDHTGKGVHWPAESPIPVTIEFIIAICYVTLVGSVPLITLMIEKEKSRTRTHVGMSIAMWFIFLGGLYLFTNVIAFQSAHWTGTRTLTMVECIYFMSQIVTTVGYGDITPAFARGQIFVGLYVLFCLFVIANLVSAMSAAVLDRSRQFSNELVALGLASRRDVEEATESQLTHRQWIRKNAPPLPTAELGQKAINLAVMVGLGVCFWHFYPGEGKTILEGVYMSIITLSTVGFGAFLPATEGGKVFGAFWMLFGAAALVNLMEAWVEFTLKLKERELFNPHNNPEVETFLQADERKGKPMDKVEFMKACLLHLQLANSEQLDKMDTEFKKMQPSNGKVDFDKVVAMLQPESGEPAIADEGPEA